MIKYEVTVYSNGAQEWRLNGRLHRVDGPAFIGEHGYEVWYLDGKCHRVGGPAVTGPNGHKEWHYKGNLHREDGPAIIEASGHKAWCLNGFEATEEEVMGHTIAVDGKEVKISRESYLKLKEAL